MFRPAHVCRIPRAFSSASRSPRSSSGNCQLQESSAASGGGSRDSRASVGSCGQQVPRAPHRLLPPGTTDLGATCATCSAARCAGQAEQQSGTGYRLPRPVGLAAASRKALWAPGPGRRLHCGSCSLGRQSENQAGNNWDGQGGQPPPRLESSPPGLHARTYSAQGLQRAPLPAEKVPSAHSTHWKPKLKLPGTESRAAGARR